MRNRIDLSQNLTTTDRSRSIPRAGDDLPQQPAGDIRTRRQWYYRVNISREVHDAERPLPRAAVLGDDCMDAAPGDDSDRARRGRAPTLRTHLGCQGPGLGID